MFLDHVYQLHGMSESITSYRNPRFTSGFWRHVFDLLDSKLQMATADPPQTNGQTERANLIAKDVLRTIATPKEWSKRLPFVEFAINNSVHACTGKTTFYVNGLHHPRTPVSFVRSPSLSGGGPLTTIGVNAEECNGFDNVMAETCSSAPTSAAVLTTQESVKSESRHTLSVLQSNDDRSSLVVTIHDRPLGSVISKLDAKSIRESQRFVDERLAITRKVRDAMASAQDKQKQICRPKLVAKIMNALD